MLGVQLTRDVVFRMNEDPTIGWLSPSGDEYCAISLGTSWEATPYDRKLSAGRYFEFQNSDVLEAGAVNLHFRDPETSVFITIGCSRRDGKPATIGTLVRAAGHTLSPTPMPELLLPPIEVAWERAVSDETIARRDEPHVAPATRAERASAERSI